MPKNRHVPERSCVACGVKSPKTQLVRVASAKGPDIEGAPTEGAVTIDKTGRAPGRGAYLCKNPTCWDKAIGKGALERSLRRELSSQDLDQVRTYYRDNIAPNVTAS